MIHLLPISTTQTIKIIPREYGVNIAMSLRDDSTNEMYFLYPTNVVKNGNYLEITDYFGFRKGKFFNFEKFEKRVLQNGGVLESINCLLTDDFKLTEGRYYDLKIYYSQFEKRVAEDGGIMEGLECLGIQYNANDLIYRDKIFCTSQDTNQINNEHYTVNKDEYKEQSSNNDFIIL